MPRQIQKHLLHGEPLQTLFNVSSVSKPLEVKTRQGAELLDLQIQNGEIVLWVIEDDDAPLRPHTLRLALTGSQLPDDMTSRTYFRTLQSGPLVLHVFVADTTPADAAL